MVIVMIGAWNKQMKKRAILATQALHSGSASLPFRSLSFLDEVGLAGERGMTACLLSLTLIEILF